VSIETQRFDDPGATLDIVLDEIDLLQKERSIRKGFLKIQKQNVAGTLDALERRI
jgi:hypothetical protein